MKNVDKHVDSSHVKPYGDTLNDGKVQVSFTLPLKCDAKAIAAAKALAGKMGLANPHVAHSTPLDEAFTFFVLYGSTVHDVDMGTIKVNAIEHRTMDMHAIDEYIEEHIGRKIVVIGASTGTDAHTVGIDAIMNMKGYAGHYGLERYGMLEAYNLGSQVSNEEFLKKAMDLRADVLLVSQTVTQKDVHVQNLTNLVELLEGLGLRHRVVLICGGPRITNEFAKELGFDAGFGVGSYADDVATYFAMELKRRLDLSRK